MSSAPLRHLLDVVQYFGPDFSSGPGHRLSGRAAVSVDRDVDRDLRVGRNVHLGDDVDHAPTPVGLRQH